MAASSGTTGPADVVAAARDNWAELGRLLEALTDEQLAAQSLCAKWDVRSALTHVIGAEAMFQGLDTPPVPDGFEPDPDTTFEYFVQGGVAARAAWGREEISAEHTAARDAMLADYEASDDTRWAEQTQGPVGPLTRIDLARLRQHETWVHLADVKIPFGMAVATAGPAVDVAVERTFALAPWGLGKKAGLPEGAGVRFDVDGESRAYRVAGGRCREVDIADVPDPDAVVSASPVDFVLFAAGRPHGADVSGSAEIADLVRDRFRIFP